MGHKILVIGSTNVDFLIKSDKLPSFGETVTGGVFMQNFGGKGANQAVGAARAGGDVTLITCLGNDLYADELLRSFEKDSIQTKYIFRDNETATGSALILLDIEGNNCISVAPGSNYRLSPAHIDQALDAFLEAEMIILQMELAPATTYYVFELAKKYKKRVLFNLAPAMPFNRDVLRQVYAFVVNEVEASMVTGLRVESDDEIRLAASALLALGPQVVVITLGSNGSFIAAAKHRQYISACKVKALDTTAAGDIYCGSLAVAFTEGKTLTDAVRFAGAAAAISVTRLGAQPSAPFRQEIEDFLSGKVKI
jgi:ribokinase